MSTKQTFVLGVGCQKAGTSWLWDYLSSMRDCAFPRPKELHIFDAMLRPELNAEFYWKAQAEQLAQPQPGLFGRGKQRRGPLFATPEKRVEMIGDPQAYVDFFRNLRPSAQIVGEITPSYATLYPAHFRFIRDLLEPHFDLRVVLLLRDPVARAFSAAKHFMRVNAKSYPVALDVDPNEYLESILSSAYILERQDYERVLKSLDVAFEPEQVHVDFYERLFTNETVRKITDFLALPETPADFGKMVNAGTISGSIDPALAAKARSFYADTYSYCEERFGKSLIEELWMPAA